MGLEYLLVRVKENSNDDYKEYRGIDLIAIRIDEDKKPMILRPIKLNEMENFYKASYNSGMKDMISDDYEYCVWYLADEDCELQCSIDISELDVIREITKEDIEEHDRNFEQFKKVHKFDERKKKLEEEERQEQIALEEFKEEEKIKFEVPTTKGNCIVEAVIYKNIAIHNNLDSKDDSVYKAITIYEGKYKGIKITSCSVAKYKDMIDEIRNSIGNKEIEKSDSDKLQEIINKY